MPLYEMDLSSTYFPGSPPPFATSPSPNCHRRLEYKGVQSREAVLKHLNEANPNIIVLDSDPPSEPRDIETLRFPSSIPSHGRFKPARPHQQDSCASSTPDPTLDLPFRKRTQDEQSFHGDNLQPTKRRKTQNELIVDTEQVIERQTMPTPPPVSTESQPKAPYNKKGNKNTLFKSRALSKDIAQILDLQPASPLPGCCPPDPRPMQHHSKANEPSPALLTFSFEDPKPQIIPPAQRGPRSLSPAKQARKKFEAASVARSQQLRASREALRNVGAGAATATENPDLPEACKPTKGVDLGHQRRHQRGSKESNGQIASPRNSLEDEEDLDQQFEILIAHVKSQQSPLTAKDRSRQNTNPISHSGPPNPFSRQAAEIWRTQNRHLDSSRGSINPQSLPTSAKKNVDTINKGGDKDGEEELEKIRIAQRVVNAFPENWQKKNHFYAVDLEENSKRSRSKAKTKIVAPGLVEVRGKLQETMGTKRIANASNKSDNSNIDKKGGDAPIQAQSTFKALSLATLDNLTSRAKIIDTSSRDGESNSYYEFPSLPEQGNPKSLKLPKGFDNFDNDRKSLVVEREIKKARLTDLELVLDVYTAAARAASLKDFDPHELNIAKYLVFFSKFAEAVVINERSGEPVRDRIRNIRTSFNYRVKKNSEELDQEVLDQRLSDILRRDIYEKLVSEMPVLRNRLSEVALECKRRSKAHGKRAASENGSVVRQPIKDRKGSKKTISSEPTAEQRTLRDLRAALARFGDQPQPQNDEPEVIDLGLPRDDDTDVSEEDEGQDLMCPAGPGGKDYTDEIYIKNAIVEAKSDGGGQTKETPRPVSRTPRAQGVDQQLLNSMLSKPNPALQGLQKFDSQLLVEARRRERNEKNLANISLTTSEKTKIGDDHNDADNDVVQESSQEFDDHDIDDDDDDDESENEDDEPKCKRYIAKGSCFGLSPVHEEVEYLLGKFLDRNKARDKVLEFATWVKTQIPKHHPNLDGAGFKESTCEMKDSFEQKVAFGDNESIVSRAWFEEELYCPSEEAYQKAKVYKACQAPDIWFVDWERTITHHEEVGADEDEDAVSKVEANEDEALVSDLSGKSETPRSGNVQRTDIKDSGKADEDEPNNSVNNTDTEKNWSENPVEKPDQAPLDVNSTMQLPLSSAPNVAVPEANSTNSINGEGDNNDDDDLFGSENPEPIRIPFNPVTPPTTSIAMSSSPSTSPPSSSSSSSSSSATSVPPPPSSSSSSATSVPPPPPIGSTPPKPQPTITRATGDHIRFFTCRALANRHAKQVFMRWYIDRLPGRQNQAFIEHEDTMMEDDLRRIGDRACWQRHEDFVEINADGRKVCDELRVWVRKGQSFGPSN